MIICDTGPLVAAVLSRDPDYRRAAYLVEQYGDLPLGTTDAAVIALAERLNVSEVATDTSASCGYGTSRP